MGYRFLVQAVGCSLGQIGVDDLLLKWHIGYFSVSLIVAHHLGWSSTRRQGSLRCRTLQRGPLRWRLEVSNSTLALLNTSWGDGRFDLGRLVLAQLRLRLPLTQEIAVLGFASLVRRWVWWPLVVAEVLLRPSLLNGRSLCVELLKALVELLAVQLTAITRAAVARVPFRIVLSIEHQSSLFQNLNL